MLESFTFWLSVLAALVAYLCVSVGLRRRAEEAKQRSGESQSPGKALDVSAIAPEIRRARQDPLAGLKDRPHHTFYRTKLIAGARLMIPQLSFLRRWRRATERPRWTSAY